MAFTQITVVGTYRLGDGTAAAGAVTFTPVVPMRNGSTVISAPVSGQLNGSGTVTVSLAATTDPGTTPTGNTYEVVEYLNNQPAARRYNIVVAYNGGQIDLATAAPAVPGPASNVYLTQADADARYELSGAGGGPSTPADGSVTNAKVAVGAAITLDKTVDSTGSTGRLALTNAERTKLSGVATGATAYTTENAQDDAAALLTGGVHTGISFAYVDASNRIDATVTGGGGGGVDTEGVQDIIGSTVLGTGLITATYNDAAGTHTIATSAAPAASPTFTGTATAPRFVNPPQTITYAATITPDASVGSLFRCTATGNLTLADPTNGVDGQSVVVEVLASGADRTLNFAGGGTAVTIPSGQWWAGTLRRNSSVWLLDDFAGGGGGFDSEVVDDRVASLIVAGTGISKTYDDTAGTLTINATGGGTLPVIVGAASLVDGTNRAAALQSLFDSVPSTGARVMLPAGWIRTQSTVQITQDNTVVQGAGLSVRDGSSQGGVGTRIGPNPGDTFTGTDILLVQRTANDRPVHGVVLQDFGVEGSTVAGTVGIHFRSNRSRIDRVSVIQCGSHGIRLHGYTSPAWDLYDSTIQGLFSDCGGTGVWFDDGATDMHILPGTVIFNNNKGIHFTGGGSAQVTGVHTYDNAVNNIHFEGAGSRTKISNCKVEGAGQHGVLIDSTIAGYSDIQITGSNLANNGDSANNTYDQIHTVGPSGNGITRLLVVGNSLTNKGGNLNLPRYGININSTALQTATIVGNTFGPASHWGTGPLRDAGSGSAVRQIRHNGGYITEASGTATVASGATTASVTHGLGATPSAAHVTVTPTNNMGNATKFWVTAVGSTTFTVNVNSDPGATTATFAWKVQVV